MGVGPFRALQADIGPDVVHEPARFDACSGFVDILVAHLIDNVELKPLAWTCMRHAMKSSI